MNLPATPSRIVSPTAMLTGNEARAYAENLSKSEMLSTFFQGSVENVLFAMELGKSYNLEPAALLQNIHVFETWKDGVKSLKATLSANLMVHLARHAGHIVTTKANANKATCTIIRGDTIFAKMLRGDIKAEELEHYSKILSTLKEMDMDPKAYAVTESVWTMDKAHTAGLVKEKGNWVKYPHAMLAARSKADAVRMACEEVLITINNDADRIGGGFVDRHGNPISTSWTHLADELGGELTDDGVDHSRRGASRQSNVIAASRNQAPQASPQSSAPATNPATARADIAAQAATDPSRAGWGKPNAAPQEETSEAPEEQAQDTQAQRVSSYVQTHPIEDTRKLILNTLSLTDEDDRAERLRLIADGLAQHRTTEEIMSVATMEHEGELPCIRIIMSAIGEYAEADVVAEVIQEVSLLDRDKDELREYVLMTFNSLRAEDRLETPVSYHHKATGQTVNSSLADAVRLLVRPLMT